MNYIDSKYINLVSSSLDKFKIKGNGVYNFRCPYCGDSQTNKIKARGYIFQKEGSAIYKCLNCGKGASFSNLLKHINPQIHKEYTLERFSSSNETRPKQISPKKNKFDFGKRPQYLKTPLGKLKKISQLKFDHPVKQYVLYRKIPSNFHFKLFYAPKFYEFASQFAPNKFKNIAKDEPRLIIPFLNKDEELIGFQGRAFGKNALRYITIKVEENSPKIFGLDSVDIYKTIHVVEGPIDSMFLNNSIAMAGADISSEFINGLSSKKIVFVFDNEPRNVEILKRIDSIVDKGYNIALFPNYIKEKDINDMVLSGRTTAEIQDIINDNTFNGLTAKAKLSEWRKYEGGGK